MLASSCEEYPPNMFYLNGEFLETVMDYIKESIIDPLYNKLNTKELTEHEEFECQKRAKHLIVYGDIEDYISDAVKSHIKTMTSQNFVDHLCGFHNIEEDAVKKFEEEKETWVHLKSHLDRVIKIVETPELILRDYEIDIIKGLRTIDAKTVNVEFMHNGLNASGKIAPGVIKRIIRDNDYFSAYDFVSSKNGEKIINDLGAAKRRGDGEKEVLTCRDITKITYGKKILYEKI